MHLALVTGLICISFFFFVTLHIYKILIALSFLESSVLPWSHFPFLCLCSSQGYHTSPMCVLLSYCFPQSLYLCILLHHCWPGSICSSSNIWQCKHPPLCPKVPGSASREGGSPRSVELWADTQVCGSAPCWSPRWWWAWWPEACPHLPEPASQQGIG